MKIELTIHEGPAPTPVQATQSLKSLADAQDFLSEALWRIMSGIGAGQKRECHIGVSVVG